MGLLLQADDSMLGVKDLGGRTPVDWAREHGQSGIVAAAQQWSSGDKRGALKTLGAGDLQGTASSVSWGLCVGCLRATRPHTATLPRPRPRPAGKDSTPSHLRVW